MGGSTNENLDVQRFAQAALEVMRDIGTEMGLDPSAFAFPPDFEAAGPSVTLTDLERFAKALRFDADLVRHGPKATSASRMLPENDQLYYVTLQPDSNVVRLSEEQAKRVDHICVRAKNRLFDPLASNNVGLSDLSLKFRGILPAFIKFILLTVFIQLIAVTSPMYVQITIDRVIGRSDYSLIAALAVCFSILGLVKIGLDWLQVRETTKFAMEFGAKIQRATLERIFHKSLSFFNGTHIGDLMSKFQSARVAQETYIRAATTILIDATIFLLVFFIMLGYPIELLVIVIGFVTSSIVLNLLTIKELIRRSAMDVERRAEEQSFLVEALRNAPSLIRLGIIERYLNRFTHFNERVIMTSRSQSDWGNLMGTAQSTLTHFQTVAVIGFGAVSILNDPNYMTLGSLIAFLSYRQIFADRAQALLNSFQSINMATMHLGRLVDFLPHALVFPDKSMIPSSPISVTMSEVWFAYRNQSKPILKDINLKITGGEFLVLTGPSGCGKSTLLNLIHGNEVPNHGWILFNGKSLSEGQLRHFGKKFGYLTQQEAVLTGTVMDNVTSFEEFPDLDSFAWACEVACFNQVVASLPNGAMTQLGDLGYSLSAGERQRLLLARTLYNRPDILLLDEATANLDARLEEKIGQNLAKLDCTRVVVTHGSAMLRFATRVLEIKDQQVLPIVR